MNLELSDLDLTRADFRMAVLIGAIMLIRNRPEGKMRRFEARADAAETVVMRAREQGRKWLSPPEVETVLASYGFEMPRSKLCTDVDAAGYRKVMETNKRAEQNQNSCEV